MRIAYFNANLNRGQDGVTRCVHRMIDAALQRGHTVTAVASDTPTHDDGIPVHTVPSVVLPLQRNYRIAYPTARSFRAHLETFRPDIIHVNSPCTLGYTAMQHARRAGIPVVATYHTHFPTYPSYYGLDAMQPVVWMLTRRFYNSVDRTFVPTRPIRDELDVAGIERLTYLPNGYDATLFNPSHRSETWRRRFGGGRNPIVLFVSRLVWEKDLRVLAEAEQLLRARGSRHELVIVGNGHARTALANMLPHAHFLGYQQGRDLSEAFASSDVFAFPSTTETFGLVTLEAMASGLAPVAASSGGALELIEDGISGFHAAPKDASDLAEKVSWLVEHDELRRHVATQAVARARQYEWSIVLDQLFHHYEDVIAHHVHRRHAHAA